MPGIFTLAESLMVVLALSADAFVSGFAYGSNKIKIPLKSVNIINIICSSVLGIALILGNFLREYIPSEVTTYLCFTILIILAITKLLDSFTKYLIRKYSTINKKIKFSLFNFKFIFNLYADPEKADIDNSKILSSYEAISLAFALSLDSIAVGLGVGIGNLNIGLIFIFSLISDALAIILGCYLGNKIVSKISFNISWLSGILLLFLAFSRLI